ncbi:MAG TPA: cysteine desulfurase [Longimicrobiales bacterium]|nr:cysteine desulfurase [Longimicrobiales bacterium]
MATRTAPALDVAALRRQFPALHQEMSGHPLVYLDSAATAQRPEAVLDATVDYYRRDNANVHRGIYDLARRSTERYEDARRTVARFLNAPDAAEVIWTRGTTEAINLVAASWGDANVGEGDEIVLSVAEHHSNLVPWQLLARRKGARLRFIGLGDDGRLALSDLDELLGPRTKLVAVGHISNTLGMVNPVAEIARRAHAVGALVLVDGAQAAPHLMADVQAANADFYAVSAHKMGGPMGIGALWARRELLDAMPPWQGGGEMISRVEWEESTWAEVPHKFEAGTPNVAGAVAMAAMVDFLEALDGDALAAHERALTAHGLEVLGGVEGLRIFGPADAEERVPVFSFEVEGIHAHDLATILDTQGIAIRAGHHCTQPLMRHLGVAATTRASCWIYSLPEEMERLAEGLLQAKKIFGV